MGRNLGQMYQSLVEITAYRDANNLQGSGSIWHQKIKLASRSQKTEQGWSHTPLTDLHLKLLQNAGPLRPDPFKLNAEMNQRQQRAFKRHYPSYS